MSEPSITELAQAGYSGYGQSTHWLNFRGEAMPSWENLPDKTKAAWEAAALSIRMADRLEVPELSPSKPTDNHIVRALVRSGTAAFNNTPTRTRLQPLHRSASLFGATQHGDLGPQDIKRMVAAMTDSGEVARTLMLPVGFDLNRVPPDLGLTVILHPALGAIGRGNAVLLSDRYADTPPAGHSVLVAVNFRL